MNFRALLSIFALLLSSISALSVVDFPLNLRVEPGTDLKLTLEGNDISKGDYVRVELWDNQKDEDVNAVILGEEVKVKSDNSVIVNIPSDFPKTKNAFVRVYYKCYNAVTPRFAIKSEKSCLTTKTPSKPTTIHPTPCVTPSIIYKPQVSTPVIIYPVAVQAGAGAGVGAGAGAGAGDGAVVAPTGTASIATSAVRTNSARSTVTRSTSTSTSSASAIKASLGSIVLALAVTMTMFF